MMLVLAEGHDLVTQWDSPGTVLLSMVIPAVILIYFFADVHVREGFSSH